MDDLEALRSTVNTLQLDLSNAFGRIAELDAQITKQKDSINAIAPLLPRAKFFRLTARCNNPLCTYQWQLQGPHREALYRILAEQAAKHSDQERCLAEGFTLCEASS